VNQEIAIAAGKAAAAAAVQAAARNAAKPGVKSSEFWATILGGAVASGLGVLAAATSPLWAIPAGVVAVAASAYAVSRGSVKKAALAACAEAVKHLPGDGK